MAANGGWGSGPSVSYPSLPPPPPGPPAHSYQPEPSPYGSSYPTSSSGSAYPPLPGGPPPVIPSMRPPSPSAPWISSSPSAAMMPPDDFADADVVQYNGGGAEPYGARGTGSGSYWAAEPLPSSALTRGESSGGLVKVDMPQVSASGRHSSGSRSEPSFTEAVSSSVEGGVHSFRVQLLGDGGSPSKDVVCKIGLDGVRITEADNGRLMRVYPLDIITRWEVKEPMVFTFWVRTAVDVDQRAVRLRSNVATTTLILDTLTAACIQVFEMVGKDKKGDGSSQAGDAKKGEGAGGAAAATPSSFAFMEWMLSKPKAAPVVPPPTVEKHHWVPDEEVAKCSTCYTDFGTFVRRHHCRNCGNVFCDKCSRGRSALTSEPGAPCVRVCDACLAEVTHRLALEKEKGEGGGDGRGGAASSAGASSSIPSHDELMKRLTDELKKSGSVSGSGGDGKVERTPSGRSSSSSASALPPALTGLPPAAMQSENRGGARGSSGGAPEGGPRRARGAPGSGAATWLSTCQFCTVVALVSGADPRCPTCGSPSAPPSSASAGADTSSQSRHQPPPPSHSHYPPPPPPSSYGGAPAMQGPPHLWPSGPGPAPPPPAPSSGTKREVVACPTCTAHLEVQVPTVGTETLQCGVCQHPFLVGSA